MQNKAQFPALLDESAKKSHGVSSAGETHSEPQPWFEERGIDWKLAGHERMIRPSTACPDLAAICGSLYYASC
jgi:hypothetical protein